MNSVEMQFVIARIACYGL